MSDTPRTDAHQEEMEVQDFDVELAETYSLARQLERELAQALKEKKEWKASHDNQVKIKNIIATRGDLKDRAPKVEKLIAELNNLKKYVSELEELFMSLK